MIQISSQLSINPPKHPSSNQPTNQPTHPPINKSTLQPTNQPTNQQINQPTHQPNQPTNAPQHINKSTNSPPTNQPPAASHITMQMARYEPRPPVECISLDTPLRTDSTYSTRLLPNILTLCHPVECKILLIA